MFWKDSISRSNWSIRASSTRPSQRASARYVSLSISSARIRSAAHLTASLLADQPLLPKSSS